MIDIFTLRGIGEQQTARTNMLSLVTNELKRRGARFTTTEVVWPASVGPANSERNWLGASLRSSIGIAKGNLADMIRATPNRAIVLGYSGGAMAASAFLEDTANGLPYTRGLEITAVGLVANPRLGMAPGRGYGIAGAHEPYPDHVPVFEAFNPADGICCCPGPDTFPLRQLAAGVEPFSFAVSGGWSADRASTLQAGARPRNLAEWWRYLAGRPAQYDLAARFMRGYLFDGQHTIRYINDGSLLRLARDLDGHVRSVGGW